MTKKEMYLAIRSAVADNSEMVDFINHEIALLDKRAATPHKPTKTQVENATFKADILIALAEADEPQTIKGLQSICPSIASLSNQRISALLTILRNEGRVTRSYVKGVAYFF